MRQRLAGFARRHRGLVASVDRANAVWLAPRLAASGLVDLAWYSELAGRPFASPRAAAQHYLTVGRRQGLVPNPLFDPSRWGTGSSRVRTWDPAIDYLRHSSTISPSVLVDPARYLADHPDAREHPGGPLGHFLTRTPAPALPVTDDVLAPTRGWEAIRPDLLAVAASWRRAERRRRPRRTDDYDAARGRDALAAALRRPAPVSPDARPLVSVIMPTRDREAEIGQALDSVRAQSLAGWELVVVDDGSTDTTADVVARQAEADPRITLVRRPPRGVSSARNAGIGVATGHYVAFLDTDNRWEPDFLHAMLGQMAASGSQAAYSATELDDGTGVWVRSFDGDLDDIRYQNHIDLNALVVSRELLDRVGHFDEALRRMVDWDLVIRIAAAAPIEHVPFVGVHYDDRPSGGRITTRESGSWLDAVVAKHEVDWEGASRSLPGRAAHRLSVVVAGARSVTATVRTVRSALEGDDDLEVLVVATGQVPFFWIAVAAALGDEPRVRTLGLDQPVNRSVARNLGMASSTGATVVLVDPGVVLPTGWAAQVRAELDDPDVVGVQLVVCGEDGTVRSTGLTAPTEHLGPREAVAADVPAERVVPPRVRLDAASPVALALRASTVVAVRGFDPVLPEPWAALDLCLRASGGAPHSFVARTDLRAVDVDGVVDVDGSGDEAGRAEFARRWVLDVDPLRPLVIRAAERLDGGASDGASAVSPDGPA